MSRLKRSPRSIVFCMNGAMGPTSGMASLNRNLLQALVQVAETHHRPLTVLSYVEDESMRPPFLPAWVRYEPFHHRPRELFKREIALAFSRPLFVLDHVGLAYPLLPFTATRWVKPVIWAQAGEAWQYIKASSRWSFRFAAVTLANSYYTFNKMRAYQVQTNAVVCQLGLSPQFPLNASIPPPLNVPIEMTAADGNSYRLGSRVLLLAARMPTTEPSKGQSELIHALPALCAEFPDVQLVLPGPGDKREILARQAQAAGVGSAVFLPGDTPPSPLLQQLYHHCYAYVMPNPIESFGLVYLEAMNYGKACVGCYGCGAEEVIVDGETGLLVHDPKDTEELRRVLSELLRNSERTASMGRAGFERLHKHFTTAQFQARFRQHIERLL